MAPTSLWQNVFLLASGYFTIADAVVKGLFARFFHSRGRNLVVAAADSVLDGARMEGTLSPRTGSRHCGTNGLLAKDDWEKMALAAGLDVVESRKIVSPAVTRAFDFFLATAWPYRLLRQFGVRFVWRPRWVERWCWRLFETLVHDGASDRADENECESGPMSDCKLTPAAPRSAAEAEGSTLLMVAEKP